MGRSPYDDVSPDCAAAAAFAQSLATLYAGRGGDVIELFAAFVGVVVERNAGVGRDCLTALDSWIEKRGE